MPSLTKDTPAAPLETMREIERLERRGGKAPLLDDQRHRWLWDLFDGMGQSWCDACRNHPRHGCTVKALLQLGHALWTTDEADRRSSLEVARALIDDALAGKAPTNHLQDAREAVDAKAAELIAGFRALRAPLPRSLEREGN